MRKHTHPIRSRPPRTFEVCEPRLALTSTWFGALFSTPPSATTAASAIHPVSSSSLEAAEVSPISVRANDDSTATAIQLGGLQGAIRASGSVGRFDERDVYQFELLTDSTVRVQLEGLSSDADLYLLNSESQIVAQSTQWLAEDETIEQDFEAGVYYVSVQQYRVWDSTRYTLDISATDRRLSDNAGNTFDTALDLGSLAGTQSFSGVVGYADDSGDLIHFNIDTASQVNFGLTGLTDDLDVYLYSSQRTQLASSIESATSNEFIAAELAAGSYYLGILPYRLAASDYTLRLTQTELSAPATPYQPTPDLPTPDLPDPTPPITTPPTTTPPIDEAPPATTPTLPEAPTDPAPIEAVPNQPFDPITPLPDTPYFGAPRDWGINEIGAPEAWSAGYTGQSVTVAVIDTGVQLDHPDLVDSLWRNPDEILGDGIDNDANGYVDDGFGWDFVDDDNLPMDANSHGTHVAGIVAAARNDIGATGVAYDASIMPIRVLSGDGSGATRDVARGIRYAVDNGADIINLSLGGSGSGQILAALEYARDNDVFVVAAAGNESASVPGFPAGYSDRLTNILSVGAYDRDGQMGSFSNAVGDSLTVQIDAPGVRIFNAVPTDEYDFLSGTSMAAPYVSGAAALVLSANPQLTSTELRNALTQGASEPVSGSDAVGSLDATMSIPWSLQGRSERAG